MEDYFDANPEIGGGWTYGRDPRGGSSCDPGGLAEGGAEHLDLLWILCGRSSKETSRVQLTRNGRLWSGDGWLVAGDRACKVEEEQKR
jgi:hypothetical protein